MGAKENARKAKAAAARARGAEASREAHARLVVERSGDPRFLQRTRNADGSLTVEIPAGRAEHVQTLFGRAAARFEEKFGRPPGPDDPLFFDPDADEPIPVSLEKVNAMWADVAARMEAEGKDPSVPLAIAEVGYMITTETRHTFSHAEIEAFRDARERHYDAWQERVRTNPPPTTEAKR